MSNLVEILLSSIKGRRTVNMPLFITKHHYTKACDVVEIWVQTFLRSALVWGCMMNFTCHFLYLWGRGGVMAALPTKSEAGSTPSVGLSTVFRYSSELILYSTLVISSDTDMRLERQGYFFELA